jgi:hypothetical protein
MKLFQSFLAVPAFGMAVFLSTAKGETPSALPPLQTVIQRVMETSAAENAQYHTFNQHYSYTRQKETEFYDASGDLKERDQKESTNTPPASLVVAQPHPVIRTVAYHRKSAEDPGPSIQGVSLGKKEDLLNPELLKRYTITLVGREMLNGRAALIVDFKPASSSLPILNIKDRFLNCFAGRVWVDEGDYVLEKVQIHLTQKVTVLGGLAGTVSKFTFSFTRNRTPDGYWFTRELDWHLEAHEATYQRVVLHHEEIDSLQKMR